MLTIAVLPDLGIASRRNNRLDGDLLIGRMFQGFIHLLFIICSIGTKSLNFLLNLGKQGINLGGIIHTIGR